MLHNHLKNLTFFQFTPPHLLNCVKPIALSIIKTADVTNPKKG